MTGMMYSDALGLVPGDVAAMIGSGGKTSLLFRLADENRGRRVLVSTTTKMFMPHVGVGSSRPCSAAGAVDWDISDAGDGGRPMAAPTAGIHLLHGGKLGEKIIAPPPGQLALACADAELALLECDGSKGLPLKGWAAYEPVVPNFVTVTVGVLPLWAVGQAVGPELVHRVELFCALTGAEIGEPVTPAHLAAVIGHPAGLFRETQGRRVLFLNYRQGEPGPELAEALVKILPPAVRQGLDAVLAGDVHSGTVRRIEL